MNNKFDQVLVLPNNHNEIEMPPYTHQIDENLIDILRNYNDEKERLEEKLREGGYLDE